MQLTQEILGAALALAGASQASPPGLVKRQEDAGFNRFNASIQDFGKHAHSVALSRLAAANSTCTADSISVRKSW
jgi:hypothetical protein